MKVICTTSCGSGFIRKALNHKDTKDTKILCALCAFVVKRLFPTPDYRAPSGRTRRKNGQALPVFDSTHTEPACDTANSRTLNKLRPVRSGDCGFQTKPGSKIAWRCGSGTTGPLSITKKSSSGLPLCSIQRTPMTTCPPGGT